MNKENYEGLRKQLDNGSLDIPSQITILESVDKYAVIKICQMLLEELQSYKQKEDKLREELLIWGEVINSTLQNKLLEILNEGDK